MASAAAAAAAADVAASTVLDSLFGDCVICSKLGWTQNHSDVCKHRRFEASKRIDYLEHMKQLEIERFDKKINAVNQRTQEEKEKDDTEIAACHAAMRLLSSVYCTCKIDAACCTCKYKERHAAMPFNAYLARCGL